VYHRPTTLDAALRHLAEAPLAVIAGGTDLYPAHIERPLPAKVLDIGAVAALRGVSRHGRRLRIGAATTWSDIAKADLPSSLQGLREAALQIGSIQIQNRGTIGGNLCTASPAADGAPPLLCADAMVELASLEGVRRLPLRDFLLGYRRTDRRDAELLTAIMIEDDPSEPRSAFAKLGARASLVISIVMAAASLGRDRDGSIAHARIAVGAASVVARRLEGLEAELIGLPAGRRPSALVRPEHLAVLSPIDDVRASAAYRLDAAAALVGATLDRAAGFGDLDA
jgi:CO/xanthine dehydrogenase FAD-binding subunit